MKNAVNSGHTITVARSSASVSGRPYDLGAGLIGVALGSYLADESGEYVTSGVVELDKRSADAYVIGETVDYDDGNEETVTDGDGASDFEVGICYEAAVATTVKVKILMNGARGPGPSHK